MNQYQQPYPPQEPPQKKRMLWPTVLLIVGLLIVSILSFLMASGILH